MDDLMTWDEYRRRHGYRDDDALRRSYEQNVMSAEGGQRFLDANPNWQELLADRPDANPRFETMSYRDFIGTRGGRSTARLGALWRKNRGMRLTPDMQHALRRSYEQQNVMSAEGGQRFQDANPRFENMSYRDFIATHGGRSTAQLGALWRKNRGMGLTSDMRRALAAAAARAGSTTPGRKQRIAPGDGGFARGFAPALPTGGDGGYKQRIAPGGGGPASGPKPTLKPTGKPTDRLTFYNAPRAGTRVSPGSVPRRKRRGGGS